MDATCLGPRLRTFLNRQVSAKTNSVNYSEVLVLVVEREDVSGGGGRYQSFNFYKLFFRLLKVPERRHSTEKVAPKGIVFRRLFFQPTLPSVLSISLFCLREKLASYFAATI